MNNPMNDNTLQDLLKAASEGPEAMEKHLKDMQESLGIPDGPELPDSIEIEYQDGTKETIDTTKPLGGQGRLPTFYSYENPAPQEVIDSWGADEDDE